MRKLIIIITLIITILGSTKAAPVSIEKARIVAYHFMLQQKIIPPNVTPDDLLDRSDSARTDCLFIFCPPTHTGFVLVPADDAVVPILGYSATNRLSFSIPNFLNCLQGYTIQINHARTHRIDPSRQTQEMWQQLMEGDALYSAGGSAIGPLLPTQWNQSPYYNEMCPYDQQASTHVVTGCVATAMAQVLRYWKKPTIGIGSHSYGHSLYGQQSANFGATSYDWDHMPAMLHGGSSQQEISAVATLMYHCGVAVEMGYGVGGSTAYLCSYGDTNFASQEQGYKRYFGYSPLIHYLNKNDYPNDAWIDTLKHELDMARVVPYCGYGSSGGHAYLIDGYDVHNLFHVNWGWGGLDDGFFAIDALPSYASDGMMLAHVEPIGSLHSTASTTSSFGGEGGESIIRIFSNEEDPNPWYAFADQPWVHLSPTSGSGPIDSLHISIDTNETDQNRSAIILIVQGSDTIRTGIVQFGYHGIDQVRPENDTIVMPITPNGIIITDTLWPGIHYVIRNPIDSNTMHYPDPMDSRLHLVSGNGTILGSTTCDIESGTDYLRFYDSYNDQMSWLMRADLSGYVADSSIVALSGDLFISFHADGYHPGTGYEIDLYVCDTFEAECRNIVAVPLGHNSLRVLWIDTSDATQWKIYYGTDPYNLTTFVYSSQQQVDITNIDIENNTYYYRIYNNSGSPESHGLCASGLGGGKALCPGSTPIVNVYTSDVHMHTADIHWDDQSIADTLRWYIRWGYDYWNLDSVTRFIDTTFYRFENLDNDRDFYYRIHNTGIACDECMPCYWPGKEHFHTLRCEWDSLDCRDIQFDNISGTSCHVTWTEYGVGTQWEVILFKENNRSDTLYSNTTGIWLTDLTPGKYYEVAIYNNAGLADSTGCERRHSFSTPCDITHSGCIEYTNFGSCLVRPRYGQYENPNIWEGAVDYGSNNPDSRHTVHRNTTERDPRTSYLLRTVAPGDTASVRLGNWRSNYQAESITYIYDVDTSEYDMLLLKYAAVLEDPDHTADEQPRFTFRIKDEENNDINPGCYSADFVADSSLGWNVNGHVRWKDWTSVGVDLGPLHDRRILIELATYDCNRGTHFGYAYFSIACDKKVIEAERCGSDYLNDLTAPSGFLYAWYDERNDSLVSTQQTYTAQGAGNYYCRLRFVGAQSDSCGFTIHASSAYKFPAAAMLIEYTDTVGCMQNIEFVSNSHVALDPELTELTNIPCEQAQWIFDDSTTLWGDTVSHVFEIGEHDVTLIAYIGNGQCSDTVHQHIRVTPTCPVYDTLLGIHCPRDTHYFHGEAITEAGTFEVVDGMYHYIAIFSDGTSYSTVYDTIVENQLPYNYNGYLFTGPVDSTTLTLQNANGCGCDSIVHYSLHIWRNTIAYLDTLICPEDIPLSWNGAVFESPGQDVATLHTIHGADSIIHLSVSIYTALKAKMIIESDRIDYSNMGHIKLIDISENGVNRTWFLPDRIDRNAITYFNYPTSEDSITIRLVAECSIGCLDTMDKSVYLITDDVFVPNAFTPKENTNTYFEIKGNHIATIQFDIFNRWGLPVFHGASLDDRWDGTLHGIECPEGSYVWKLSYTTIYEPRIVKQRVGTVLLLR